MSCNHPYKGYRTGYKTENGKDEMILVMQDMETSRIDVGRIKQDVLLGSAPHEVEAGHVFLTDPVSIPCGVCVGCRMDRAREWKIRNCLELREYPEAYFVTLTYDDAHCHFDSLGASVLVKKDFQDFLKRLRKKIGYLRYFACGEYGDRTGRAHYHAILYCHLSDLRNCGVQKWTSPAVDAAWRNGIAVIESVTPGSIAYVAGYVEKKFKADYSNHAVKPFLMMSTKPAIGLTYFIKRLPKYQKDMKVYGVFDSSKKGSSATVPKAFRRRLEDQPWYEEWKEAAKLSGEKMQEVMKVVYQCADYAQLHFAQDKSLLEKLRKYRKEKI